MTLKPLVSNNTIDMTMLWRVFHLPEDLASKVLRVDTNTFVTAYRAVGIACWPFHEVQLRQNVVAAILSSIRRNCHEKTGELRKEILLKRQLRVELFKLMYVYERYACLVTPSDRKLVFSLCCPYYACKYDSDVALECC